MSDKPKIGATKYTDEGIDPARAFWVEAEAYRKAINERVAKISDPNLRLEILQLINAQGASLLGLRDALYVLQVFGIEAKRERLDDGETLPTET
jgi:hypothetical protein